MRFAFGNRIGTGFWVSDTAVITCRHVLKGIATKNVEFEWMEHKFHASTVRRAECDLAIVTVDKQECSDRCVLMNSAASSGDRLFCYGYTDQRPKGDPAEPEIEGGTDKSDEWKLRGAQIRPGLSGAPLLNRQTGFVCALVRKTRQRASDLGGYAIPAFLIQESFPEVRKWQVAFHSDNNTWTKLLPALNQNELSILAEVGFASCEETFCNLKQRHSTLTIVRAIQMLWQTEADPTRHGVWCSGVGFLRDSVALDFLEGILGSTKEPYAMREARRAIKEHYP